MMESNDKPTINLVTWLPSQPREVSIALAARFGLRELIAIATKDDAVTGHFSLPATRALLTACCEAVWPGSALKQQADSAGARANKAGNAFSAGDDPKGKAAMTVFRNSRSARHAANGTGLIAWSARQDDIDVCVHMALSVLSPPNQRIESNHWHAVTADVRFLVGVGPVADLFATPLWPNGAMPEGLRADYEKLQAFWDADLETWGFWARWYDGMLRGAPLDWELQRAIALIDDRVWNEGPEAVAAEIREIEENLISERLPQAEEIIFDMDRAQFATRPISVNAQDLVETTLRQVDFALKVLDSNIKCNG
jgi:hypothetical protein